MHSNNCAHLDVKLDNILLDNNYNIKIADFGTTVVLNGKDGFTNRKCGTIHYMAPEICDNKNHNFFNAYKADVYSLGVTLYHLLTGAFPISSKTADSSSTVTSDSGKNFDCSKLDDEHFNPLSCFSEELNSLLSGMLAQDPEKRMSIFEVLSHPWLTSALYVSPSDVYMVWLFTQL